MLAIDRERPRLGRLAAITDPEAFVWAILPHAARTFAASIALLPGRSALPGAVAYLYCRMLDTYEDLVPGCAQVESALRAFAARLDEPASAARLLPPAPAIDGATDRDDRDRAHLLLVRRAELVDRVFLSFDAATRAVVRDLVRDMAHGMLWSSATFAAQGGVLIGEEQLVNYCRHVLGNPAVFSVRIVRLGHRQAPELTAAEREDAMQVGEMVQLANVTRDIEKDLRRGIAYDAALRHDLGRDAAADPELAERCRAVRARMLGLALSRAPAYGRVLEAFRLPRWSVARASAVLMFLFTERYFRACARRVGGAGWHGPTHILSLWSRALLSSVSARFARREVARVERAFLTAAAG